MDLFTYLLKKKGHNSSVNGDLFSYLLASRKRGTYQTYTGTQINVSDSINARMKNWILGGNSNQNGTPTPDAPIDIHNVIGENNVIENSGKNLYEPILNNVNLNGLTPKIENDGSISVSGTITQTWSGMCKRQNIYLEAGTYTFSLSQTYTHRVVLRIFKSKLAEDQQETNYENVEIGPGSTKKTFTTTSKIYGWRVYITALTANTEVNENFKIQVETGSTATPFEKYKGKNYKVSLFNNISIPENQNIYITGTGLNYNVGSDNIGVAIPIKAQTSYQISVSETMSRYRVGTTTNFSTSGGTLNNGTIKDNSSDKITINNTTDNYLIINVSDLSKVVVNEIYELCKIGDYQDKIYKSNDKWLLEKNVGKAVLNGSMNWFLAQTNTNTLRFGSTSALQNGLITNSMKIICNNFPNGTGTNDNSDNEHIRSAVAEFPNYLFINIDKTRANDLTTFENWLNNNQTIVYYITNAPVITEITDDNLIEQLEQLSKARSFDEQTNITQLSEQLPFDLTVDIKTL